MADLTLSFSRWVVARSIAFGVLVTDWGNADRGADCLEITRRNLLLHNDAARTNYLEGPSLDAMLWSACLYGYTYLWVQSPGHYILDKPGIQLAIEEEMRAGFFVLGHVLDRGAQYYSIHHQSIIVNIRTWQDIGKPAFGRAGIADRLLHVPIRSETNFHDTHTPTWIKPSGTFDMFKEQGDGWEFLSRGLDCGVRIAPFSRAIRARKGYLYPEEDTGYYFKLGDYRRRAREWADAVWVSNTEELTIPSVDFSGPVETMIGVASGLKLYLLLFKLGFTSETVVNYVDSSQATLEFKEWLLHNWDGSDYSGVVNTWFARQRPNTRLQKNFSEARLIEGAANLYSQFGGEARFIACWEQLRKLPHTFSHLDLFTNDYHKVVKMIPATSDHVLLWLSNVFHSYYTHSLLSHEEGEKLYLGWIGILKYANPRALLLCKDHFHAPVAGRVGEIVVDRSVPIPRNRYFPPEIVEWFNSDLECIREVRVYG